MPLLHEAEDNCFLGLGMNFLTLFWNEKAGAGHFGIAIENLDADAVMEQLKQQALKPRRLPAVDHHA